jgi:hypothetical protein
MALALVLVLACRETTGSLAPDLERRFAQETILRRADDLVFRYTRDPGGRREIREDRLASVVVTRETVLIHKNDKVGIEITPRSRRAYAIERDGSRVRVRSGQGRGEELWSFVPPEDPAGWAADMRAVIRAGSGPR